MPFNTNTNDWMSVLDFNSKRVIPDINDIIMEVSPNEYGLYKILEKAGGVRTTNNVKIEWIDRETYPFKTETNASATATDTTIHVTEPIFVPNDIIKVPSTGELMLVTSIDKSAGTVTVIRGYGAVGGTAIASGATLIEVGNVNPEGGRSPEMKNNIGENFYNYTQIFRTAMRFTRNALKLDTIDKVGTVKEITQSKAIEHNKKIERALIYGERKLDTTSFSEVARSTGGVMQYLTSNIMDLTAGGGNLTKAQFDEFVRDYVWGYKTAKTRNKIILCGSNVMDALNDWLDNKMTITNPEYKKIGVIVKEYNTYKGGALIYASSIMDELELSDSAIAIDPAVIKLVYNEKTKLRNNIQLPDEDAVKSEYLTDVGFEVRAEKSLALLSGVVSHS